MFYSCLLCSMVFRIFVYLAFSSNCYFWVELFSGNPFFFNEQQWTLSKDKLKMVTMIHVNSNDSLWQILFPFAIDSPLQEFIIMNLISKMGLRYAVDNMPLVTSAGVLHLNVPFTNLAVGGLRCPDGSYLVFIDPCPTTCTDIWFI